MRLRSWKILPGAVTTGWSAGAVTVAVIPVEIQTGTRNGGRLYEKLLTRLREKLIMLYEKEMKPYTSDPWEVRNKYIQVMLDRKNDNVKNFLTKILETDFLKMMK